jgi:hypothetical protein
MQRVALVWSTKVPQPFTTLTVKIYTKSDLEESGVYF